MESAPPAPAFGAEYYEIVRGRLTGPGVTPFVGETTGACVAAAVAGGSVPRSLDPTGGEVRCFVSRDAGHDAARPASPGPHPRPARSRESIAWQALQRIA